MPATLHRAPSPGHDHPARNTVRQTGRGLDAEDGAATIELMILMPVVFGLLFLGVQAGLIFHARQIVLAAANEGVVAASVEGGSAEAGHAVADDFLGQVGDVVLGSWNVAATRDADRTVVTVHARPYTIIEILAPEVSATAELPTETVRGAP